MRVFLSGLTVAFHRSNVIACFWGFALSYVFLEASRSYRPYLNGTNNAIASAAQYQIFFTYFCAFMLVAKPFGGFGTPLSCVLLCANLVIFAVALHRARAELRARREVEILKQQTHDLAAHIKDFEKRVLGIVAVERSILKNDRTRFLPGGDWCATASRSDVIAAAQDIELDLVGVEQKEDELRRFLAVAAKQEAKGEVANWYIEVVPYVLLKTKFEL